MTLANLHSLLVIAKAYRVSGHEQHAQAALDDAIAAVAEMASQRPADGATGR
jgi:hypothetical protein